MKLDMEPADRRRSFSQPSRRDMFKIGTATAAGVGAAAVVPAVPAAAAVPTMNPMAFMPMETATTSNLSYATASSGYSIGPVLIDPTLAQANLAAKVNIPTYDGSGVAVHPSVYFNQDAWNGYEYWMAHTPYPSANNQLENPSMAVSHDGNTWIIPDGLSNPIEPVPAGGAYYNSDPNIVVGNDGLMYLFWRTVGVPSAAETWYYRTSANGLTWSDKAVIREDLQSVRRMLSPSFTQLKDGSWVAYAVDILPSPFVVVRLQALTLDGFKAATPQKVNIVGNPVRPWHIDVHRASGLWQMLVQDGGSGGGDLWAAISADGINFQAGPACIKRNAGQWDSAYYKSCFVPAMKNGVVGWDTWVTGASFVASGSIMGRTFISFNGSITPVVARTESAPAADPSAVETALLVQLLAAKSGTYPWIAGDSFSRPDNASIGSADSGQAWIANVGTMKITNRAASPAATANTRCVIDVGTANHWLSVRIDSPSTATAQHWLLARFQDSNNFYRFGLNPGGPLQLQKLVAGALTTVSILPGITVALPGTTIGLRCIGTTFDMFMNNAKIGSITDTSLTAGTKAGIQGNDGTATFRAFTVRVS